ncbi:MAG: hypothetical protein H6719_19235 [Sandaracinaceae bacterium]|nr:hypothetical protein [Sandaracinaceae bacterium]
MRVALERAMRCGLFFLLVLGCAEPPAARTAPLEQASIALGADEVLLDARGAELLVGRIEPAPEGSDADRVLVARGAGIDGRRVLDARFVGALLVVLDADHRLRVIDGEREAVLDERAEAPLSVAGDAIAYARGEMPDFEVARAIPSSGEVTAVAPDVRPAWSPALSPDGREVVFVTSVTGTPRLYRPGRGFVDAPRFATTPSAPLWRGEQLVVGDERGVAWLDLEGGQLVREDAELTALLATADGRVLARRGAAYEALR